MAFWLPAIGGSLLPMLPVTGPLYPWQEYIWGYLIALDALLVIAIMARIPRHTSSEEQCLLMGLLLGIAACWMPLIVLLTLPVWGWLIYRNLFSFRAFLATLVGYATVAIWWVVIAAFKAYLGGFPLPSILNPSFHQSINSQFSILNSQFPQSIPVLSLLLAWLLSAITNHYIRERSNRMMD